jgi:hypothetical protein
MQHDTPQSILAEALFHRDRLQFDRVVALCDRASIAEFFTSYCDLVREPTEAEIAEQFPELPEDQRVGVLIAMRSRKEKSRARIPRDVPGTRSVAELFALSPEEFMRRKLEGDDVRCKIIRGLNHRGKAIPSTIYEPPTGLTYEMGDAEVIADGEVRVPFTMRFEDGKSSDVVEYEELRMSGTGTWGLIVHNAVLRSRGLSGMLISQDLSELLLEDLY